VGTASARSPKASGCALQPLGSASHRVRPASARCPARATRRQTPAAPRARAPIHVGFGFVQGYNAQTAVNEQQIVLAAKITNASTDVSQLDPMVSGTLDELGRAGIRQLPKAVVDGVRTPRPRAEAPQSPKGTALCLANAPANATTISPRSLMSAAVAPRSPEGLTVGAPRGRSMVSKPRPRCHR
jgi:hypothetical protein